MSRFRIAAAWLGVAMLLTMLPRAADAQCSCVITDLGTLGGTRGVALGVNDAGDVVGGAYTTTGYNHAFLWTASTGMMDLGTLGGDQFSTAEDVNNTGQVVGWSQPEEGPGNAFRWTASTGMVELLGGGQSNGASGVNDTGDVVGATTLNVLPGGFLPRAVLWTATGPINLGTLGGLSSAASGINNAGRVVGYADTASNQSHAFLWTATTGMVDLATLGGPSSYALAINAAGQVVGYSSTASGETHAFLWTATAGMVDLGTLGGTTSQAWGINDAGQVVGTSLVADAVTKHAFVWTAATGMVDLGTVGGRNSYAYAINNAGQVVGASELTPNSADVHAVLWQPALVLAPVTANVTFPVPAGTPVTWTAAASGGVAPLSFQFWVFDGTTWTLGRDWGPSDSWTWDPPLPGTYSVQVWVRNAGSSNAYDAWQAASASISTPTAFTVTAVTPNVLSAPAGTPVTWTATALSGTGPYSYRFFVFDGTTWTVGQEWSPANTWTWTPPTPGTYSFQVWARNAGSSAAYDAWRIFGPSTVTRPAWLKVTTLTPDLPDPDFPPPTGTPVRWTATAAGGTGPYTYKFWLFDGVAWMVGQDWSPSASWIRVTTTPGSYHVQVWVRNAGSATPYDAVGDAVGAAVGNINPQSFSDAIVTVDRTFPVPAGTPVRWTVHPIGGSGPYTYLFWVFDGTVWTVAQDWSVSDSWTWVPPSAGSYSVQIWIRNVGSTATYNSAVVFGSPLAVSSPTVLSVDSLSSAPMSPLFAREPATLTATATGGTGPYVYQFWVYDGSAWTIGQAWSASNTFTWRPSSAGTYWIQVWVRNASTISSYDAWTGFGPLTVLP